MDLMMRRRALMGNKSGKNPNNIALTIDDNPAMMAICYESGFAANPNYITIEEAGSVSGDAGQFNKPDVTHMDLRYFTGLVTKIWQLGNISNKKLTLPAKPSPMGVNAGLGATYKDFIVVIPPEVTRLDLFFINNTASGENATIICEGATPFKIEGGRTTWFADMPKNEVVMYVPNNALTAYKEHPVFGEYEIYSIDDYVN